MVSPGRPLEDQSTDRLLVLAPTRRMQAGSNVSKTPARLTLAAKENCFVLSVGNQDTLPEVSTDTPHAGRKQRQQNASPTNTSREGKLLCFKCGKPGHFARECFSNKFSNRKNGGKNGHSKSQGESHAALMLKRLVETPIVRKTCN